MLTTTKQIQFIIKKTYCQNLLNVKKLYIKNEILYDKIF